MAAKISEISFTKNPESEFFIKKKKSGRWEGRGWVWLR